MNLVLPKIESDVLTRDYGRFLIGPMETGYGITLGNALRRVLLSSLEGAAIISIMVRGIHHEFSTIPHVREDMTSLLLNLKQVRFTFQDDEEESARIRLEVQGEGVVTAGDIIAPPIVEIVNPEAYLLTTDSDEAELEIEMTVARGRGYSPAEERGKLPLAEIPVDAIYSPVRKVNYTVTRARIGQQTNYDRLNLEIWTDGAISPEDALREAARLLVRHLTLIAGADVMPVEAMAAEISGVPGRIYDVPIEELELTVRAYNCLKRAGITKVGEVLERLQKGEDEILAIRNFGRKSLHELVEKLNNKGYLSAISYQPSLVADIEDDRIEGDSEEEL